MNFRDHFAGVAEAYAVFRPGYPEALFEWLASLAPAASVVWDCACGSGQASRPLAERFSRVVATDASMSQLASAPDLENVVFSAAAAECAPFLDRSIGLVTIGSALHWFSGEAFYSEVRRVVRPGGILAAWTYGLPEIGDMGVEAAVNRFGSETMAEYWPLEVRHVIEGYTSLEVPFTEFAVPEFDMVVRWERPQLLGFVRSWSAVGACLEDRGTDPVAELEDELTGLWAEPGEVKEVRWSLAVRAAMV